MHIESGFVPWWQLILASILSGLAGALFVAFLIRMVRWIWREGAGGG